MLCYLKNIDSEETYNGKSTISLWHNLVTHFDILKNLCDKKTIGLLIKNEEDNYFIFANGVIIIVPKFYYNIEYI